ncbi:hypothetical protein K443DRAFT_2645 [Laccaria amethystina LaAM-08-1]|uniref:Uncharacterized protein n=1 Tax=Laccaria amethystina LaAM-08-1 TaxID=1095629 RepID=A0A0C9XQ08_9AGAR|nr:hypothetical protein K443DRAFT_2645 [Laccaria amethystina LaAM-08-1]
MPSGFIEILMMIVIDLQKRQGRLKEAFCDECFEVYISFSQPHMACAEIGFSALYAFPGASLFFFTALGIAAIGVEISTPHVKYFIFRGRSPGRGMYRGATRLAALLEIKEDQRSEVESVDLKGSPGEGSAVMNKLPDSKLEREQHRARAKYEPI